MSTVHLMTINGVYGYPELPYDLLLNMTSMTAGSINIRPYIMLLGTSSHLFFGMDLPSYESLLEEQVSFDLVW